MNAKNLKMFCNSRKGEKNVNIPPEEWLVYYDTNHL